MRRWEVRVSEYGTFQLEERLPIEKVTDLLNAASWAKSSEMETLITKVIAMYLNPPAIYINKDKP